MPKKISFKRLTPYLRGAIFAFALAGFTLDDIQSEVTKTDGAPPCLQTISDTIARGEKEGGLREPLAGRVAQPQPSTRKS